MSIRSFAGVAVLLIAAFYLVLPVKSGASSVGAGQGSLSESRIAAGLKEALQIGVGNAVNLTGKVDGYFRNQAIKILMPRQLQSLEKGLRAVGFGPQADEFILSMNRAAEKAAPEARKIFFDAIKAMTINDARKILTGGETSVTAYFKEKTNAKLTTAFRPIIVKSMNEVGVTRQYKELVGAIPFARTQSLDLDQYVLGKALDGLFYMVGEEERKIRRDPAARVTSILRDVFGR